MPPAPLVTAGLTAVRTVGSILPADLLASVATGRDLPGLTADDYHLEYGTTPKEAANRAWSVLTGAWEGYRKAIDARPEGDHAVGLTREKWLGVLLNHLGFGRVPTTPAGGLPADDRAFPVSHLADGRVPVHLLGWRTDLDKRTPGLAGAADRAPHAMVQDLLNRSEPYLWAILASGNRLRLLRDASSLVGPSYVEFDLETIFDGDLFSDFAVLYLLCHQSRFEPTDPELGVASCWLERWRSHAADIGARALGALRDGVHDAIEALGTGFLTHPANHQVRADLEAGTIYATDVQRSLLRLVYRLLFCFVAEDRDQLLDPSDPDAAQRYIDWYSTARLRRLSTRRRGDNHTDLWTALTLVLEGLGKEDGCPPLALPGLGGIFEHGPADVTTGCQLSNRYLLDAVRCLSVITPAGGGPRRMVDYRNLGAEELGGIYESLLEFVPSHDPATHAFTLTSLAGNDRKKTGAYYTPTSLTECLLDTALDPLIDRAAKQPDPEAALLALTVCDPACGSGHFLVAAGRRIANRLAAIRAGGDEPTLDQLAAAMHDVVARCLYGVDINPMAAELAKVSLWLEGLQAGAPLGLLDAHIKVGNALLGTTPALLAGGIPDAAFTTIEGDDKKVANALKARNRRERSGQDNLFNAAGLAAPTADLAARLAAIDRLPSHHLADVHVAATRLRDLDTSPEMRRARLAADAWCAAFVLPKVAGAPELTHNDLVRLASPGGPRSDDELLLAAITDAQERYRFFHWHLEFPHIFARPNAAADPATGWSGGFDCVLGNPPWERVKLQEQEWFAARDPDIATAPNAAARKRMIAALADDHPDLHSDFLAARRQAEGDSHLIRSTGRYPLCGRGDINTYAIFAEADRSLLAPTGRLGVILPTGIATDATTQHFFKDLVVTRSLASLFDFENSDKLFEAVDSRVKFCLLTLAGRSDTVDSASFAFFAHNPADLARDGVRFTLTPEEITLLNPNTGTCPVFRTRRDAELTLAIYRRHPVLIRKGDPDGNSWGIVFTTMFHMSNDSGLFRTRQQLEPDGWVLDGNVFRRGPESMLPLYVGLMTSFYDHRAADVVHSATAVQRQNQPRYLGDEEKGHRDRFAVPASWVERDEVERRLAGRWALDWLLGFSDITSSTNERTLVPSLLPFSAVGNNFPLVFGPEQSGGLLTALSSFVIDFVARTKVGGTHMNFFLMEQLPVPHPSAFAGRCVWDPGRTLQDWLEDRVDELIYTADDMAPAAASLGDDGPPFVWDPDRRAVLRAELDAAFFHLYGIDSCDDVDYILGTFPIVNRNDVKRHGEERTRRLVLESYDAMAKAMDAGIPFVSQLDPPPGDGLRHGRQQ